jgi:PAS domain S-box-containing protein
MDEQPIHILMVEDEQTHAELVCRAFEAHADRFHLTVVSSLEQARDCLAQARPDLVIADLVLPDGKGTDLLPVEERPYFPLVAMTSHGNEQVAVEAIKAGALDYIVKTETTLADMPHVAERALREWRHVVERARAESRLRASEERYRRLLESVTDYIYTVKIEEGQPAATSHGPACVAVTGYTSEDYAADPHLWHRMVHEGDKEAVTHQAAQVLSGGSPPPLEHRLIHKDGSIRWVRHTPVSRRDEQGRLVAYDGLIADITERKRAEEALRVGEERLRSLFEQANDAIFIENENDEILDVNTRACKLLGYSREELLRMHVPDLQAPEVRGQLGTVIKGELMRGSQPTETLDIHRDGTRIPVEVSTTRVRGGEDGLALSIVRDITRRKRAEDALRESMEVEARAKAAEAAKLELEKEIAYRMKAEEALQEQFHFLQKLIDTIPTPIFYKDIHGVYQGCNAAFEAYLGLPKEAIVGKLIYDIAPQDLAETYREADLALFRQPGIQTYETSVLYADGTRHDVIFNKAAFRNADGSVGGLAGTILDITDRKRAEEALNRRAAQLALISDVGRKIAAALDLGEVLSRAARLVQQGFGYHHVALFTVDRDRGELVMKARAGEFANLYPLDHRIKLGQGMVGWAGVHGVRLLANDVRSEPRYVNFFPGVIPTQSELCVPIRVGSENVGVLDVQSPQQDAFDGNDVMVMETLADQIAIAISNARLYEAVQRELAERKRAEEALETERRRLFAVLEELPAWIYLQAPDHSIRFANRYFREQFGETEASPCYEVLWGRLEPCEECGTFRVFDTQTPQEWEWSQTPNGRIYQLYAYPFTDIDGSPLVLELGIDITERKRAEEELKRRNKELSARNAIATTVGQSLDLDHILKATLDTVLQVIEIDAGWIQLIDEDKEERTLSMVAQRGLSEVMAQEVRTLRWGEGLSGQVAQSGQPLVVSSASDDPRLATESGRREGLHAFAAVPIQSKEKVQGVLGIVSRRPRELSSHEVQLLTAVGHQIGLAIENVRLAKKASEIELLREVDRLRSELLANISHELRTPLGLITVFCTTLLRDDVDFDRETRREFLHDIREETDKLEELVDNLLDLSRIQDGRLRLDKSPTDISQLARKVVKPLEIQIAQSESHLLTETGLLHRLLHDFSPDPLVAMVDPKSIEQVLRNLLSNAIKYSPEGGTITIQGREDRGQILVRVSDQGVGIPAEEQDKIFERFYRVENEITQNVRGAGLGLPVCRGIVEAHGGRMWVESAPGVGSAFCFALPLEPDQNSTEPAGE